MIETHPITHAIASHAKWKYRLRQAIDTGMSDWTVAEVRADDRCEFGEWLRDLPAVAETRGVGPLAVVELKASAAGGYLDDVGPRLYHAFLERGVLLRPLGNVLYFLPPYVVTDEQAHEVFDSMEEVIAAL